MINTIADLLNKFKEKEIELMKQYEIVKHPGIIGDMYEGLSKDILEKSIFEGLNLRVISGKIKNNDGHFSDEIDCMLIEGDAESIPHTDKFICHFHQVIAVIQIKKNLYSKDIDDSYNNLRSVIKIAEFRDGEEWVGRIFRDAYRLITRSNPPDRNMIKYLPKKYEMIYHSLLLCAFFPIRIVWGYNGFVDEHGFRESFQKMLENKAKDKTLQKGYSPMNFPNLIMCRNNCIIKNDGMPYGKFITEEDFYWNILVSTAGNPIYFLLELIWTRLTYKYGISSLIFGDDFHDLVHPFINCRFTEKNNIGGWEYMYIPLSKKKLIEPYEKVDWQPQFIDEPTAYVFEYLIQHEQMNIFSEVFDIILKKFGLNMDEFLEYLLATGLIFCNNNRIKLLTDKCTMGFDPELGFFVGEDKDSKVTMWKNKRNKIHLKSKKD